MIIKKVCLENIRSYKNQEIIFPYGSTLLSGDIGSGKTTILLAIEFALFGLQPGQKGSSLLSSSADIGKVSLDIEVNGLDIKIERTLKKTNKSIVQDYSALTINGDKEEMSVTELKTKVLEILNYPQEFLKKTNMLYRYTIYSPQELMKQIIIEDPESRLNILRHVFEVDKYKTIKENLSLIAMKLREKSRILQYELRDLEESKVSLDSRKGFLNSIQDKIELKKDELAKRKEERKLIELSIKEVESKIDEKDNFEKEIEKTRIAASYKSKERSSVMAEINDLQARIMDSKPFDQELLNRIIKEIELKDNSISLTNNEIIRVSSALQSLESKQKHDISKRERIFKIDICPTCLQDVSESHKHNILNETETEISKANREIALIKDRELELYSKMKAEKDSLAALLAQKSELEVLKSKALDMTMTQEKLSRLLKQKDQLDTDISLLDKHISLLKHSVLEFSKYSNIYSIKQDELKVAFQKEKKTEIELAEFKKEIEITKKDIDNLEREIMKKEATKGRLSKILEIEQWMSTTLTDMILYTERNIMLKLRNEFSKYFNKWFSMLTTDNFFVRLDESFTPVITQGDYELDYSFLSGGERTAVALAYRLSLNQIINSIHSRINTQDIVILDEPTEGFSSQQLDKVRDVLQELNVNQLIVVSHEPKIESFVDNIIKIRKEAGESKIL